MPSKCKTSVAQNVSQSTQSDALNHPVTVNKVVVTCPKLAGKFRMSSESGGGGETINAQRHAQLTNRSDPGRPASFTGKFRMSCDCFKNVSQSPHSVFLNRPIATDLVGNSRLSMRSSSKGKLIHRFHLIKSNKCFLCFQMENLQHICKFTFKMTDLLQYR